MVIKAKNSLTLVRTDDGLPAYIHNAWAWSADGTDRFTKQYPGENLYVKNNSKHGYFSYDGTGSIVGDGTYTRSIYCLSKISIPSEINKISLTLYNNSTPLTLPRDVNSRLMFWDVNGEGLLRTEQYKNSSAKNSFLIDVPEKASSFSWVTPDETFLTVKIEFNSETIYTPSPLEDPEGAYPHYMGTYSDNSPTASTNPADYHWQADPTYLEHSKVNGNDYENDKDTIYEALEDKANSDELSDLKNSADKLIEDFGTFTGKGGTYEQGLIALEERAVGLYKDLGDKLLKLNFINTWFKVGEEGLVIGAEGSNIKMLLNNESLSFLDGGKVVAYFTNQNFYINKGAVVKSLQVGSHAMISLGEEDTVIQFVGGAIA